MLDDYNTSAEEGIRTGFWSPRVLIKSQKADTVQQGGNFPNKTHYRHSLPKMNFY